MADDWLLRWDPRVDARPRLVLATSGLGQRLDVHEDADGFVAFDGWLGEPTAGTASPAAYVARLWRDGGARALEQLRGGFVLIVWRETERALTIARDALGPGSCWWSRRGRVLLLSPSLHRVRAEPEVRGAVRRVALAEHALGEWSDAQRFESYYEDVARLPAGHLLEGDRDGTVARRWFVPTSEPLRWADADELAAFPDVLARAVRRCLAGGADCLALSGGFDSVSIAVLAAAERPARPIHALSVHFSDPVCDESAVQRRVADALGITQTLRRLEDGLAGEDVISASRHLAADGPGPALSPWDAVYLALLRDARAEGRSALMTGSGGDELLGVSPGYGIDALTAGRLGDLASFIATCRRAYGTPARTLWRGIARPAASALARAWLPRAPLAWLRARRAEDTVPSWIVDPELRAGLVARAQASFAPPGLHHAYEHDVRRMLDAPLLALEQEQAHAWARAAGFRLMAPFFDRDVVQLLLASRPAALLAGGYPKAPLRALLRTRLASVALPAKKVDFTSMAHATLRDPGRAYWRRIEGARTLAALGIVDARMLERAMNDYFEGRNEDWSQVWLTLSAETWLRAQNA